MANEGVEKHVSDNRIRLVLSQHKKSFRLVVSEYARDTGEKRASRLFLAVMLASH